MKNKIYDKLIRIAAISLLTISLFIGSLLLLLLEQLIDFVLG
tara:strand:- start:407 stop:532 length:126 start_codon:yes stop_codon:yes gene_type:complete